MDNILVVEDDRTTNNAIAEYLRCSGYKVYCAFDGKAALELFSKEKIELVVLDIMIPYITGIGVLHEIRNTSSVPVIMLTALSDENTQVITFDEQADDFLAKPFSLVILGKRIEALLRRSAHSNHGSAERVIKLEGNEIDFSGYSVTRDGKRIDVTPKELQILKYLIDNKEIVVTRNQILDHIWSDDFINDRTIDSYIKNLRKKLVLTSIITVKGVGYKFESK